MDRNVQSERIVSMKWKNSEYLIDFKKQVRNTCALFAIHWVDGGLQADEASPDKNHLYELYQRHKISQTWLEHWLDTLLDPGVVP